MTPQEQANLDRVFGRIHVKTQQGGLHPLNPIPDESSKPSVGTAKKETKQAIVANIAPRHETSPLLDALKRTLPPPEENKVPSRPADAPKGPSA